MERVVVVRYECLVLLVLCAHLCHVYRVVDTSRQYHSFFQVDHRFAQVRLQVE